MIVSGAACAHPQKPCIVIHRLDKGADKQQEADVFGRLFTRREQVLSGVGHQGPVVVLAGTVDAFKRLFMKQAGEAVLFRRLGKNFHGQLVVIHGHVGVGIDRRQFKLTRGDLVVLGLCVDAELPEFIIDIAHEFGDPLRKGTEVMVREFLPLGSRCAEERASGKAQVRPLFKVLPVNQEVLLFKTDDRRAGTDFLFAEQIDHAGCGGGDCLDGFEQRILLVERFAVIGYEYGRDAEDVVLDEYRAGHIPVCIAACLEGCAQAAARETGRIRFSLDEIFSGEMRHGFAGAVRIDECVMLFGSGAGQRLEPVGVMGCAVFQCPALHGVRDGIGGLTVKRPLIGNGFLQRKINRLGQTFLHH